MKSWWCQTCNLQNTARCKYWNNIFFHVLTKLGTPQYHLLQSAEMETATYPNGLKNEHTVFENTCLNTPQESTYDVESMPWSDRHQLNQGPTQWQHFDKLCTEQLWTWKWCRKSTVKKTNNGMSETKVFLLTEILHFVLNRNKHNLDGKCLYKNLHGGHCTRLLVEMGHLGSHISQHLGK